MFFKKNNPYYSGPVSDHFDGKRFFNPWNPKMPTFWDVLKWKISAKPAIWPKHFLNTWLEDIPTNYDFQKNQVIFIGHASFLVIIDGVTILIDPIYSKYAGPLKTKKLRRITPPGIKIEDLPKIDIVLVSHAHYDHCDMACLRKLYHRDHPQFIVPLGMDTLLKKISRSLRVEALDWYEEFISCKLCITLTPAQHWSQRSAKDKNCSLWGGFVIKGENKKIFFVGDSGYDENLFKEIKAHFGSFDLAMIPIGAYKPRWFMKYAHMDPREACLTHMDLESKKSVAMHHRCFPFTDEGLFEPTEELENYKNAFKIPKDAFITSQEGQSTIF